MLITAFILGFAGSLHCIGMCGPIALALPVRNNSVWARLQSSIIYNAGRIVTYAIAGMLFGLFGQSIAFAGYQRWLSISIGILILLMMALPKSFTEKFKLTKLAYRFIGAIKTKFASLFKQKTYTSLFSIGLLNGLLPCGLVYLGIAGAIATADVFKSALFMMLFGLGTLPAMMSMNFAAKFVTPNFRLKITKAMPVLVVTMALLFIIRGMNLGIPYLSPQLTVPEDKMHNCCAK